MDTRAGGQAEDAGRVEHYERGELHHGPLLHLQQSNVRGIWQRVGKHYVGKSFFYLHHARRR